MGFGKKDKRSELSATPSLNQHLSCYWWELMLCQVTARSVNAKMKAIEPLVGKAERMKLEVAAGCHGVGGGIWKETLRFALPCLAGFELVLPSPNTACCFCNGIVIFWRLNILPRKTDKTRDVGRGWSSNNTVKLSRDIQGLSPTLSVALRVEVWHSPARARKDLHWNRFAKTTEIIEVY